MVQYSYLMILLIIVFFEIKLIEVVFAYLIIYLILLLKLMFF